MFLASLFAFLLTALPAAAPPDLALKGSVVARDEAASVAVLSSGGRTRIVAMGENAFGGQLVSVASDSVVLAFGEERATVRLSPPQASPHRARLPHRPRRAPQWPASRQPRRSACRAPMSIAAWLWRWTASWPRQRSRL